MHAMRSIVLTTSFLLAAGGARAETCQNNLPPDNPDTVYADNGDGTVTDLRNGLMWKQCVEGRSGADCSGTATEVSWATAQGLAQDSTFAGFSDWRLPNVRELESLLETCHSHPAINTVLFPGDGSVYEWTGSPDVEAASAWYVNIDVGNTYNTTIDGFARVRLVRGGFLHADLIFRDGFDGGG